MPEGMSESLTPITTWQKGAAMKSKKGIFINQFMEVWESYLHCRDILFSLYEQGKVKASELEEYRSPIIDKYAGKVIRTFPKFKLMRCLAIVELAIEDVARLIEFIREKQGQIPLAEANEEVSHV